MAKRFLTLDIGAANVVLAEYEAGGRRPPKLLRFGTAALAAPIDDGDPATILVPALMEAAREAGIRPGPVAISISGQMVFPRFAAIPAAEGGEKFEQLVRYEIEQNVPFPIDEMICDRQILGDTPDGEKDVMIVSAKTEQVEAVTDAVAGAGFRPELVDVAPLALTNAIRAASGGDESCVIILDIGAKTTSLVIVEGDRIYNRSIPIAGNTLTREIAQALGCTAEEAEQVKCERGYVALGGVVEDEDEVADRVSKVSRAVMTRLQAEISRSVNFYRSQQGGGVPNHLYLTGGSALLGQIDQFFAESLQVEVSFFNPFDYISYGSALDEDTIGASGAFLAPTVGLALHAAGAARFAINLLPPSIVSLRAEKARIPVVAAAGVLLLAGLVCILLAGRHADEVVQAKQAEISSSVSVLQNDELKLKKANDAAAAAQASADEIRQLLQARSATAARVAAVRDALPPGAWIESWSEEVKDGVSQNVVIVRGWRDRLQAFVAEAARQNGGKGQSETAPELVVSKLRSTQLFAPESLLAKKSPNNKGLSDQVEQFEVHFSYK